MPFRPLLAGLALLAAVASSSAARLPLHVIADVPLSGESGRFDYQSIDPGAHRLFISHMGPGTVHVVDLEKRKEIANVQGLTGATGVLAVPSLHRVFVSATGHFWNRALNGGDVVAIDENSGRITWKTPVGRFPDSIVFVPGLNRLFVSDESGGEEVVLDAVSGRQIGKIPLDGEAGMTTYDGERNRILVNVQTRNDIAIIDPAKLKIERRVGLPDDCRNNHGLLIGPADVFVACDENATLFVLDRASLAVKRRFPVGDEPDVLALDSVRQRLYVASESGTVSVFDTGRLAKLGEGFAGPNAHSITVDPETGLVYLPLNEKGRPILRILEETPR